MEKFKLISNMIRRIIGVTITSTGKLDLKYQEDRFKLSQIIKAAFMIDFNAARIMVNDMANKKFEQPYEIKGFSFSPNVFTSVATPHNIEYGYLYSNTDEKTKVSTVDKIDCRGLAKFNLQQLSEYIEDIENSNHELLKQITEKDLVIAKLEQTLFQLATESRELYNLVLKGAREYANTASTSKGLIEDLKPRDKNL